MPRLASAMRNSRFLSRWAKLRKTTTFTKPIDNLVQTTDKPKSTFYPCQIMCLPISVKITWNPCLVWPALCGIHGFWDYGKQRLFRSAIDNLVQSTDKPKSTFYPCQIMCLHISVKITWNTCPVWPALCGIHGFWVGRDYWPQLFRSNSQLGEIEWQAQKHFLHMPHNVPTHFR